MTQTDPTTTDTAMTAVTGPTSSPSLEQYDLERLTNVRQHLPDAANQLKGAGVACVHIQYDGCGDSGQIESIEYVGADGKPIDILGKIKITEDALMDLFYDLTQARHPGWENNDGAFGSFAFDIGKRTIQLEFNGRFTDVATHNYDL